MTSLVLAPTRPATLYAQVPGNEGFGIGGLYRSRDGGASWRQVRPASRGPVLAVDPARPRTLYGLDMLGPALGPGLDVSTDGETS